MPSPERWAQLATVDKKLELNKLTQESSCQKCSWTWPYVVDIVELIVRHKVTVMTTGKVLPLSVLNCVVKGTIWLEWKDEEWYKPREEETKKDSKQVPWASDEVRSTAMLDAHHMLWQVEE